MSVNVNDFSSSSHILPAHSRLGSYGEEVQVKRVEIHEGFEEECLRGCFGFRVIIVDGR